MSVTVRVAPVPPFTLVGETLAALIAGAFTVSVLVFVMPLRTPEITTVVFEACGTVETVKVFVFVPEATVTEAGTVATPVLALESATTLPPEGALALSVTVPVEVAPPVTLVGLSVTDERLCAAAGRARLSERTAKRQGPGERRLFFKRISSPRRPPKFRRSRRTE